MEGITATMTLLYGITIVVVGVLAVLAGYFLRKKVVEAKIISAEEMAKKILQDAEQQVETKKREAIIEAKDKLYKVKTEFEEEVRVKRQEIQNLERKVTQREDNAEKKMELVEKRERDIGHRERDVQNREKTLKDKETYLSRAIEEERSKLERISGLTTEAAKKMLIISLEEEAKIAGSKLVKQVEDEAKELANEKAKRIISIAISRAAMDHTVESTVSVFPLPNEEMKGRIIGREGRNIRALETATGVDIIVDDTPETILISAFDGVRRETARRTLEYLVADGRIHPSRIEETVNKVKQEMESHLREVGEQTMMEVGVVGIHSELLKVLGRLKYRTSYAQNVLLHSIEVANLAGVIAAELGVNPALVKRAGLLHDIGKAIDAEVEGTHPQVGAELAKRYNESPQVIQAILDHHGDDTQRTLEAIIVQAADAISASRPGARGDTKESYIKRIKKLEEIATTFGGVQKSYAIQAGREIRILVEHEEMDDVKAAQLARDIAKKIEQELQYPGQIKVIVIRETRFTEYAK